MNLYDTSFLLFFIIALIILGYRFYNNLVMWLDSPVYGLPGVFITFCAYLLSWLFCLVVVLHDPSETFFSSLLYLLNWGLVLNALFLINEIIFVVKQASTLPIKAYQSQNVAKVAYAPDRR